MSKSTIWHSTNPYAMYHTFGSNRWRNEVYKGQDKLCDFCGDMYKTSMDDLQSVLIGDSEASKFLWMCWDCHKNIFDRGEE